MDYITQISNFITGSRQESKDKGVILNFIQKNPDNILMRKNEIAHITSSGFIMNANLSKVLLVHHNIRNTWAWTGGHADGNGDLLSVAIKEAKEETGAVEITPLSREIASIDILPVFGHMKKGNYINSHLHLSIAYILLCSENEQFTVKPDENTGVEWFAVEKFNNRYFDDGDVYLYNKLIAKARTLGKTN